jgi:hypothetical protein
MRGILYGLVFVVMFLAVEALGYREGYEVAKRDAVIERAAAIRARDDQWRMARLIPFSRND